MEKESLIKRYLVFIAGLYFLAMGISLIVHSSLGTTPISSMNYVLSINTSLSLGTWTFIVNLLMIIIQLWLASGKYGTRKDTIEILLQIPFSFIFSAFIDLNMILIHNLVPSNYGMAVGILLAGCIIQSIGVVLEIKPKAAMMSAEGLVKYIARRCNKKFGSVKVYVDITLVSLAILISLAFTMRIEGVREGSVIAACITGYIVNFLNYKVMTRKTLYRIIPIKHE
jgi:uncharacterized membrane protein YczE